MNLWPLSLIAVAAALIGWGREARLRRMLLQAPDGAEARDDQPLRARLAQLERSVAESEAILHNALDGFFLLGEDYRFLKVNPAFCQMLGYSATELLMMKMVDLEVSRSLAPESTTRLRTGLHHFATAHRHKSGRIVQLESCVVVLRDRGETVLAGFSRDVTERYHAEVALMRSEEQYRSLVETSRDLIWSVDTEGRWRFVNNAAIEIYGYTPAEMLGRPFTDFLAPHRIEADLHTFGQIKAGEGIHRYETEHVRRDGRSIFLSFNAIPLYDQHGQIMGTTGTARDITEQREAEQRIRAANARFESLVAEMPLGYVVWSEQLQITGWNPAASEIFGFSLDEAGGRRIDELLIPSESQSAFGDMRRQLLEGNAAAGLVIPVRTRTGQLLTCEWFNTVLTDPQGRIQCIVSLIRDISEKSRLEAKLLQAQKLESLGVLAGGVAHDFNNIMQIILSHASLAIDGAAEPLRANLDKVLVAAERARDLTQRLLAYAGRATIDVKPIALNELIRELIGFSSSVIPANVQVVLELEPNLPSVDGDPIQLQQVLLNLIINSVEAIGGKPGAITISTWLRTLDEDQLGRYRTFRLSPGTYVKLQIADTGCGMPQETLERIFEPFYTTKFAGRGLGLSAIHGIVKAHHGGIYVTSTLGQGTTFRLAFPLGRLIAAASIGTTPRSSNSAAEKSRATAPRPAADAPKLGATAQLLVIDDEPEIREVVRAVLEARGMRVLTAADGPSGIELFRAHAAAIDAVLLDINMPGMSGAAVHRELTAIRPNVKVILSTGYAENDAASQFDANPPTAFVHKPYTPKKLLEQISAVLATP